jgi:Flp pilus assembly protein TadG
MTDLHRPVPERLLGDEEGATLVEFAIVISLFLLIFFALIDFGRLAYHIVTGERAMHAAARLGAVRPPACPGVPEFLSLSSSALSSTDYGTSCNAGGSICQDPGPVTCVGDLSNPTAAEVWDTVRSVLPPGSDVSNLRFRYTYDARLGFLGGPYVPVVTVEMEDVTFEFVTPLAGLAAVAGATGNSGLDSTVTMPSMSVSLPGEDLAQGEDG